MYGATENRFASFNVYFIVPQVPTVVKIHNEMNERTWRQLMGA